MMKYHLETKVRVKVTDQDGVDDRNVKDDCKDRVKHSEMSD